MRIGDGLRVILLHGNMGAGVTGIWFPWVAARLEALGFEVTARDFPDPMKGRQRYWMPFLRDELRPDRRTVLVGHSSGGLAALRYCETAPVLGSVLVAVQRTDCGFELERRSGFFDTPFDWPAIRANQRFIQQYHAPDDPWIPIDEARDIHLRLGSTLIELPGEGHFGGAGRDKPAFPELVTNLSAAVDHWRAATTVEAD